MRIINLYRYTRYDGGITVSTVKPNKNYTLMYRLVADEGKTITNGKTFTPCVDVDSTVGWYEIDGEEEF